MSELDKSLYGLCEDRSQYLGSLLEQSLNEKKKKWMSIQEELNQELAHAKQVKGYNQRNLDNLKRVLSEKQITGAATARVRTGRTPLRMPSKYLSSEKLRKITRSKSPISGSVEPKKKVFTRLLV